MKFSECEVELNTDLVSWYQEHIWTPPRSFQQQLDTGTNFSTTRVKVCMKFRKIDSSRVQNKFSRLELVKR